LAYAPLSARQAEIAKMIASGKSAREIALALQLSPRTVETHVAAIYSKYGVGSRAELIIAVLGGGVRLSENSAARSTKTNLPLRNSRLIGRENDIEKIVRALHDSRLVSIVGAGGIGKTCTALAVGEAVLTSFKHGVRLVELAALPSGSLVNEAVARGLGIPDSADGALVEKLVAHLETKTLLIVLDNCEHVIGEATGLVDAVLQACPDVRILTTSREPLQIVGERTFRLPSLGVAAAVELFKERAQAVDSGFTLDDGNAPLVARICRALDGIPLAIELAAARTNVLSLPTLATQLTSHLRILTGGERTAAPRHRTMRALVDWSYELLSPVEQRLFEGLSVFTGGCALAQATDVCGDGSADEIAVLERLSSLVDKSLVVASLSGNEPRYNLLQPFRHYAADKLAARGEAAEHVHRHTVAYVELAERLDGEFDLAPSSAWFERVESDLDNFHSALHRSLDRKGDGLLLQRLVAAMRPIWPNTRGAHRWLGIALELIDDRTPARLAARLEYAAAFVAYISFQPEATVAICRRQIATYEALGDPVRVAYAQGLAALALVALHRVDEAEPLSIRALETARKHGPAPLVASSLQAAAQISFLRGDLAAGRAHLAESRSIYETLGAARHAAQVGALLAEAEFRAGNVEAAFELMTQCMADHRKRGYTYFLSITLTNLALYCIALERWSDARAHALEAFRISYEVQEMSFCAAGALLHVATVIVLSPGFAELSTEQLDAATQLLGCAARHLKLGGGSVPDYDSEYDRVVGRLLELTASGDLEKRLARGASMTLDKAAELLFALMLEG
jgi:predicted ATPase/DNA-binding CsgD family transcriptional regulator